MGKLENVEAFPSTTLDTQGTTRSSSGRNRCCSACRAIGQLVSYKCVLVLVLGVGVLLSAVFWLPFLNSEDQKDLDLEYAGHDIVASFLLKKPVSFLKNNTLQLENNIFDEMSFSSTKVEILSLESSAGLNTTKVVFAVESDATTQSLIKASFVSLITHQSFLQFTTSLFGDPFSFEVLKFRGGITAAPYQKAFLLQSVQILFNFTLNFSIGEILMNFDELSKQLKTGLHLSPYENLYIRLTNLKGSTVDPPTTVQSQVLLAVGINPSKLRLKQLALTISSSHAKNLGLNNNVFGRVKQVRLSSILQHSLGNDASSPSPSPAPSPSPMLKPYNHNRQKDHRHISVSPVISPSPSTVSGRSASRSGLPISTPVLAPAPQKNIPAESPGCHFVFRFPWMHENHHHAAPSAPPAYTPHAAPSRSKQSYKQSPGESPVPAASKLPNVHHTHHQHPSHGEYRARPPDAMPLIFPSPSPSSARTLSNRIQLWLLFLLYGLYF